MTTTPQQQAPTGFTVEDVRRALADVTKPLNSSEISERCAALYGGSSVLAYELRASVVKALAALTETGELVSIRKADGRDAEYAWVLPFWGHAGMRYYLRRDALDAWRDEMTRRRDMWASAERNAARLRELLPTADGRTANVQVGPMRADGRPNDITIYINAEDMALLVGMLSR